MTRTIFTFVLLGVLTCFNSVAQTKGDSQHENFFGIDRTHKIIVCHQSMTDSLFAKNSNLNAIKFGDDTYAFEEAHDSLHTTEQYKVTHKEDTFQLFVTALPLLKIRAKDSIKDEPKTNAILAYADSIVQFTSQIAIEWRGNSALKYPKKSYDLELRKDSIGTISIDHSLGRLRDDDDWILNSLYNERLKLRSYVATKLWLDVRNTAKQNGDKKKKVGNDLAFAEVFLNGTYEGVYLLSEQVDRKQLKLKKMKNDTVYGALFKANSYANASSFKSAPTFNNAFPHWAGFEMKYPYENFEAHWEHIYQFVALTAGDDDEKFTARIEQYLDIDNAIDYFLFVNLVRATDNLGKNYYLARHSNNTPYFFIPWDLDGIMGYIQDAKRIETTGDVLSNALFDRLLASNPVNYRSRLKKRWEELRAGMYSDEALLKRLDEAYSFLKEHQIYERDQLVWPRASDPETELRYLYGWLEKRTQFLDALCAGFD